MNPTLTVLNGAEGAGVLRRTGADEPAPAVHGAHACVLAWRRHAGAGRGTAVRRFEPLRAPAPGHRGIELLARSSVEAGEAFARV